MMLLGCGCGRCCWGRGCGSVARGPPHGLFVHIDAVHIVHITVVPFALVAVAIIEFLAVVALEAFLHLCLGGEQ